MSKQILLSIRPEWVAKILNGEKTIEVRKRFPKDYGSLCYDCEKQMAENGVSCPFRSISNEFCDNYNFLYFIINFKKEDKNDK